MKRVLFIGMLIIIILIGICIWSINRGDSDYSNLYVGDILLNKSEFSAKAVQESSGKSFRKYDYQIDNDSLYITLFSGIVTRSYPSGTIQIEINDSQLNKVRHVYLKNKNDTKLIYTV